MKTCRQVYAILMLRSLLAAKYPPRVGVAAPARDSAARDVSKRLLGTSHGNAPAQGDRAPDYDSDSDEPSYGCILPQGIIEIPFFADVLQCADWVHSCIPEIPFVGTDFMICPDGAYFTETNPMCSYSKYISTLGILNQSDVQL